MLSCVTVDVLTAVVIAQAVLSMCWHCAVQDSFAELKVKEIKNGR